MSTSRPPRKIKEMFTLIAALNFINDSEDTSGIKGYSSLLIDVCPYIRAIGIVVRIGMAAVGHHDRADEHDRAAENERQAVPGLLKPQKVPEKMALIDAINDNQDGPSAIWRPVDWKREIVPQRMLLCDMMLW